MRKRVAVIEGEDAAPETVRPAVALVDSLGLGIEWVYPAVGEAGEARYGSAFPEEARRVIDGSDATLFGSASAKTLPALFYLRWGKTTYANVRPARWLPGYRSPLARPEGVDFVIVRENLEDAYIRVEGPVEGLAACGFVSPVTRRPVAEMGPGRFSVKVITEAGTERVVRFAFELARRRKARGRPGKVTCSSKYNMLPESDGFFRDVAQRVARSYPDVGFETFIVDDLAHRLVAQPHNLDVVVLPNLYGDILSDAAAAVIGGMGLAPSGCYGEGYAYFESVHGTAPDIAGQNRINPTATILSAALMLEYLGFGEASRRLEEAVARTYAEGRCLTPDQGGTATTTEFTEEIAKHL